MNRPDQAALAATFHARHHTPPLLLLPNAWDALSARLFAHAGFEAIATTSGGVAWALGYPDGEVAPWPEVVAATARITRAVDIPVTADIEGGYGADAAEVGAHVGDIIATGVAGINLEDSRHGTMRPLAESAERLAAAREVAEHAGVPLVINARCDVFLHQGGAPETLLEDAVARGRAYLSAGADCVYPIGLADMAMIADYVAAIGAPVNVLAQSRLPDADALEAIGVARVSVGTRQALAAAGAILEVAGKLHDQRDFRSIDSLFGHTQMQALFADR